MSTVCDILELLASRLPISDKIEFVKWIMDASDVPVLLIKTMAMFIAYEACLVTSDGQLILSEILQHRLH